MDKAIRAPAPGKTRPSPRQPAITPPPPPPLEIGVLNTVLRPRVLRQRTMFKWGKNETEGAKTGIPIYKYRNIY